MEDLRLRKDLDQIKDRFWSKVYLPFEAIAEDCLEFKGTTLEDGYGQFVLESHRYPAHKFSWLLYKWPIENDLLVLHKCDCRACINPEHLFLGTQLDNMRDMVSKDRQAKGFKNGNSFLTDRQVLEIKEEYKSGNITLKKLSVKYNCGISQVSRIINNQSRIINLVTTKG